MSDDLTVQWYGDLGTSIIFDGDQHIATVAKGDRRETTQRLRLLGLRPKRWRKYDWGAESKLVRGIDAARSQQKERCSPTLICDLCGADRYKEPCKSSRMDCPIRGIAARSQQDKP